MDRDADILAVADLAVQNLLEDRPHPALTHDRDYEMIASIRPGNILGEAEYIRCPDRALVLLSVQAALLKQTHAKKRNQPQRSGWARPETGEACVHLIDHFFLSLGRYVSRKRHVRPS